MLSIFKKNEPKICVVTGHYGSGKSSFSVNLALKLKKTFSDEYVSMCDLDIVNPYFRSADSEKVLIENGIDVIMQQFANSNVDTPSIPPELNKVFEREGKSVLDIGGDDSGAAVVGGICEKIKNYGYYHFFVLNFYRPLTNTPEKAFVYLKEIENMSRLPFTHIVNNTNLGEETEYNKVLDYVKMAEEFATICGLQNNLINSAMSIAGEKSLENFFMMKDFTKRFF